MADESKNPPILRRTPFVGSGGNRMVHKTDRDCPRSRDIKPDERWYIKEIPKDGNYTLCPYCFGDDSTPLPDVQAPESRFKNLFSRKTKEQRESLPETDRPADGGVEVSAEESGPQEAAEAVTPPAGKSTRKSVAGSAAGGKSAVKIAVVQKKAMEDSVEKKAVVKKAAPKKKVAPKKKAAPKKKVAPKKKAAPKKKVAPKKKAAPKKKVAPKK